MFWSNLLVFPLVIPRQTSPRSIYLKDSFPPGHPTNYKSQATGSSLGVFEQLSSKNEFAVCVYVVTDAPLRDLALFIREIFSRRSGGTDHKEADIIEITVGFYRV